MKYLPLISGTLGFVAIFTFLYILAGVSSNLNAQWVCKDGYTMDVLFKYECLPTPKK